LEYLEERIFALVVELVFFPAFRVHKQIVYGNPYLSFGFRQSAILSFWDHIPLAIFIDLSFSVLVGSDPRSFLDKWHKKGVDIALYQEMMNDTDLKMFDVIGDVSQYRNAHDEEVELDIIDLLVELLNGCSFENFLDLLLFLFFFCYLLLLALLFSFNFAVFDAVSDLFGDLLVAVVNNFDQKLSTFIYGGAMEHQDFKNVADNAFVIDGEIDLH
jgi:hypothetical protein